MVCFVGKLFTVLSASLAIFHASAVHIIHVLHVEGFAALIAPALFALAAETDVILAEAGRRVVVRSADAILHRTGIRVQVAIGYVVGRGAVVVIVIVPVTVGAVAWKVRGGPTMPSAAG